MGVFWFLKICGTIVLRNCVTGLLVAKSAELKNLIIAQVKKEWADPNGGGDWKDGVTDEIFVKLCNPKNWKRTYKGRGLFGNGAKDDFMMRTFDFGDEDGVMITATVTCDKDDNKVLDIEFEQQ